MNIDFELETLRAFIRDRPIGDQTNACLDAVSAIAAAFAAERQRFLNILDEAFHYDWPIQDVVNLVQSGLSVEEWRGQSPLSGRPLCPECATPLSGGVHQLVVTCLSCGEAWRLSDNLSKVISKA